MAVAATSTMEPAVQTRIAAHMNKDFRPTVLALARTNGAPGAEAVRVTGVSFAALTITAADASHRRTTVHYAFEPPLDKAGDAVERLRAAHADACAAATRMSPFTVAFCVAYFGLILAGGLTTWEALEPLRAAAAVVLPTEFALAWLAKMFLALQVVQLPVALYYALGRLRLGRGAALGWAGLTLLCGPIALLKLAPLANAELLSAKPYARPPEHSTIPALSEVEKLRRQNEELAARLAAMEKKGAKAE